MEYRLSPRRLNWREPGDPETVAHECDGKDHYLVDLSRCVFPVAVRLGEGHGVVQIRREGACPNPVRCDGALEDLIAQNDAEMTIKYN